MFNLQSKWSLCDAVYIVNTQQTNTKITDSYFSYVQRLLKNGQKSDSFTAHFEQHFKPTTSHKDWHECMTLKLVNQINPIGVIKSFVKTNYNLCLEERLMILKNLCDKRVTLMNKNSEIYGAWMHKTNFRLFWLITDDTINGWKDWTIQRILNLRV